jgi:hypothetical protein
LPPLLNIPTPPSLSPTLLPPPIGLPAPLAQPGGQTISPNRQSVIIDEKDENKQLLESILASTRTLNNGDTQPPNNG